MKKVQKLCLFSFVIGAILSWPALVIYGIKITATSVPDLYGQECSTADTMKGKPYPLIYYGKFLFRISLTLAMTKWRQ
jgi:hypothetical protein